MFTRNRLVAAAFAVAVATSVAVQAAAARETKAPRTLLTTIKPIRAFAQDEGRIAWIAGNWRVEVRKLGGTRKPKTVLVGSARPFSSLAPKALPPHLELAGSRVLWTRSGGGNELETDIYARKPGDLHRPRLVGSGAGDNEQGGGFFGALAGAGSTAVYSFVEYRCLFDPQGGCSELELNSFVPGTFRVTGTSGNDRLPAVPTAIELAVSGRRIAVLPPDDRVTQFSDPASPPFAAPGLTVQVFDTVTASRLGQFTPPGKVRALALSGTVGAVMDEAADGTRTIERYSTATGALVGSTTVAAGDTLVARGNTLVYAVGNQVETMNAATGARQVLATSPGPPIGLSVAGKRVAWAVNVHGHGRVLAVTLP